MHVLATWEIGRGCGHIGILASVSRALRAAGHRVTLAACHPQAAALRSAHDFDAVIAAPRFEGLTEAVEAVTYAQVIAAAGFHSGTILRELVSRWLVLIDALQPDAMLVEHAPASLLAARLAGVPAWRIGSSFVAPALADLGTSLLPWREISRAMLADLATVTDPAIRFASGEAVSGLADLISSAPRFATTWPELDHFAGGAAAGSFHGDLGLGQGGDALDWPRSPGPRVLVHLPHDRPAGLALRDALRRLRWPTNWHWPGAAGSDAEGAVRFTADAVDLNQGAAQARIFIGRGGHGASAIMLRAGVPQLLVPDTLESSLLCYRMRGAGLVVTQPVDALPTDFGKALVALASGELDEALQAVKRKYAAYDPERAARRIAAAIAPGPMGRIARRFTMLGR